MSTTSNEYRFERVNDSNIADLLPLYHNAFMRERPLELVKNKFDTGVFGAKYIAYMAYAADNTVAALYVMFPVIVEHNGRKVLAAQIGDLMTHSNHRRKGLYLTLANITHELARKEGVELFFTVLYGENASFIGFTTRLGFTYLHPTNGYYLKVNTFPASSLMLKAKASETIYDPLVTKLLSLTHRQKESFSNTVDTKQALVVRSKDFFDYKYSYSPARIYQFAGVGFYLKIELGTIKVGDVEKVSADKFKQAMDRLKRFAFFTGMRSIQFEASPGSWLDEQLKPYGTPATNYRMCILNFSGIDDNLIKFTFADFDNY